MSPEQLVQFQDAMRRLAKLEQELHQFMYPDRYQFDRNTIITGPKIALYKKTPVAQGTAIGSPSVASVSGSGADATINSNFTNVKNAIDSIRTALQNIGITA